MSGYLKYFDNGGKNMHLKLKMKYNEIWNKIKTFLGIKFHSQPIYDDKYIKTKVKTFSSLINTLFSGKKRKKRNHYICIAAICIDSVLRIGKKMYPQVDLEQCKYKIKKES